jgi:hypothetical protein
VIGALLVVLSIALGWFFLPRDGEPDRWMMLPFFETSIPLLIVIGFAVGLTMLAEFIL